MSLCKVLIAKYILIQVTLFDPFGRFMSHVQIWFSVLQTGLQIMRQDLDNRHWKSPFIFKNILPWLWSATLSHHTRLRAAVIAMSASILLIATFCRDETIHCSPRTFFCLALALNGWQIKSSSSPAHEKQLTHTHRTSQDSTHNILLYIISLPLPKF